MVPESVSIDADVFVLELQDLRVAALLGGGGRHRHQDEEHGDLKHRISETWLHLSVLTTFMIGSCWTNMGTERL